MNGRDLKPGDIFKYDGKTWECKSNDGFMLSADNVDKNDMSKSMSWIGSIEKHDVEIVAQ